MKSWVPLGMLLLIASGRSAAAQDRSDWIPPGSALGVTVDRFEFDDDFGLTAATVHVSSLKPNTLTPEFAASLFPRAIASRILFTNLDVGGAWNVPAPHATLLLRGGASGLFVLGGEGGSAIGGVHFGASILLKLEGRSGLRFDLTYRLYFTPYEEGTGAVTLGLGITSLPAIR